MPLVSLQLEAQSRPRPSLALRTLVVLAASVCLVATAAAADGMPAESPSIGPVPIDFILFGLTLLGVALFHHQPLKVALTGLAVIIAYKLTFTGFKEGPGVGGLLLR